MSPAPTPPANRRRISSAVFSSPRANARVRAMRARGRSSSGASASNSPRTRSAQSAAHAATRRRSASWCRHRGLRSRLSPRAHLRIDPLRVNRPALLVQSLAARPSSPETQRRTCPLSGSDEDPALLNCLPHGPDPCVASANEGLPATNSPGSPHQIPRRRRTNRGCAREGSFGGRTGRSAMW